MTRALIQMMQQYIPGNLLDPIPPLFVASAAREMPTPTFWLWSRFPRPNGA